LLLKSDPQWFNGIAPYSFLDLSGTAKLQKVLFQGGRRRGGYLGSEVLHAVPAYHG
jgi:hypothetical protein